MILSRATPSRAWLGIVLPGGAVLETNDTDRHPRPATIEEFTDCLPLGLRADLGVEPQETRSLLGR